MILKGGCEDWDPSDDLSLGPGGEENHKLAVVTQLL